ncbi:LysR family transcriptional regulator [Paenibacillus larvae]|uniref:HTH-type transcriptional regulator BsdA n=1 Tax=Paenibacillus larvae subsp. larvae TaxID=147375 RepID=A0A6C0QTH8_9BACL|nr:LysR family transcriptional regulator [Paenibacillus larvae]QHZ51920.1 HTH-type transcriptional regulator BsdA [Paenibacillus larvae subsp. larvae]
MDVRQLRYFLAIAKESQITRAAKSLNMEQPPLSRQLKLMEQELQVTLFEREGRRLRLTPAGERLRQRAESIILQLNETVKEVKEIEEGVQGTLSIGSAVSCVSLLPSKIDLFRQRYPQVTFTITEGDHIILGEQLERRNIEMIVARLPFEAASKTMPYSVLPLPSDPFVAVLPSSWSSEPAQQMIRMCELADFPFLALKTDQTTGMNQKVVNECRLHGIEPQIICECSSVAMILALVASGIGVTVMPKSVMESFLLPNIKTLNITDVKLQSEVGILWLKDRFLSKNARHFIEVFSE